MKKNYPHHFHIPVMGLGYTIDTPVKVARFGINSVISIIEDHLIEQMREVICLKEGLVYEKFPSKNSITGPDALLLILICLITLLKNKQRYCVTKNLPMEAKYASILKCSLTPVLPNNYINHLHFMATKTEK